MTTNAAECKLLNLITGMVLERLGFFPPKSPVLNMQTFYYCGGSRGLVVTYLEF